jgi:hypothetical protein
MILFVEVMFIRVSHVMSGLKSFKIFLKFDMGEFH